MCDELEAAYQRLTVMQHSSRHHGYANAEASSRIRLHTASWRADVATGGATHGAEGRSHAAESPVMVRSRWGRAHAMVVPHCVSTSVALSVVPHCKGMPPHSARAAMVGGGRYRGCLAAMACAALAATPPWRCFRTSNVLSY